MSTILLTISDEVKNVLAYCCDKYECRVEDLVEDAIREYYIEDMRELRVKPRESED